MSTINTILIKRRLPNSPLTDLPILSGGELAFNEKNYTLYYGASGVSGIDSIAIGGDGAFVNRTSNQTVEGDKTFVGSTTLSAVTFSPNSVIDLGANLITNVLNPLNDQDAATKKYVDDLGTSGNTAVETLSSEIYNTFVKLVDDRAVDLSGSLTVTSGISSDTINTSGNVDVGGNLRVTGNLEILGSTTSIETTTTTTSSFQVHNYGTDTALVVTQVNGTNDVAEFKDGADTALIVKGDGTVGIGTANPNEKLTVFGNLSASGNVYAVNGDFSGTLDADGATILGSTLYVTNAATFASSVSAAGALTIDGLATFNADATVVDKLQVQSYDFNPGVAGTHVEVEGTTVKVVQCGATSVEANYTLNGISTVNTNATYTIQTDNNHEILISANGGGNDIDLQASNVNITNGGLQLQSGDLNGIGVNSITNFIIDGGSF